MRGGRTSVAAGGAATRLFLRRVRSAAGCTTSGRSPTRTPSMATGSFKFARRPTTTVDGGLTDSPAKDESLQQPSTLSVPPLSPNHRDDRVDRNPAISDHACESCNQRKQPRRNYQTEQDSAKPRVWVRQGGNNKKRGKQWRTQAQLAPHEGHENRVQAAVAKQTNVYGRKRKQKRNMENKACSDAKLVVDELDQLVEVKLAHLLNRQRACASLHSTKHTSAIRPVKHSKSR